MPLKQKAGSPRRTATRHAHEERGDASNKILHRTIVVCAIGLLGVVAFAISPKKTPAPSAAAVTTRAEAKAPVASFDRASLSTKNR